MCINWVAITFFPLWLTISPLVSYPFLLRLIVSHCLLSFTCFLARVLSFTICRFPSLVCRLTFSSLTVPPPGKREHCLPSVFNNVSVLIQVVFITGLWRQPSSATVDQFKYVIVVTCKWQASLNPVSGDGLFLSVIVYRVFLFVHSTEQGEMTGMHT